MDDKRKQLENLAVAIADRNEVFLTQAINAGADVLAVLESNRTKLAEVSSDFDGQDALLLQQLYTEEVERRAEASSKAFAELEKKSEVAKARWMLDGKISREKVREYVKNELDALDLFAKNGGNRHQMALDQQDVLADLLDGLDDDVKLKIINMQAEEINAATAKLNDELYSYQSLPLETVDANPQPSTIEIESSSIKEIFFILAFIGFIAFICFKVFS